MTDPLYKHMTAFLLGQGIEEMEHTGKTYLGHLIAVHRMMEEQACSTDACRAGLFHSIYGTEAFQRFQSGIAGRCIDPPQSADATIIGNYRMVGR